ncbi:DUF3857 domain-containing protein [bacterium]|nr:MAG: DUF3857 domain-containing protein [bacterium]
MSLFQKKSNQFNFFITLILLGLIVTACFSGASIIEFDGNYSRIIAARPKGNNVVVNYKSKDIKVYKDNMYRVTEKKSVTVYTKEQAEQYAIFSAYYNSFISVKSMKGNVYDQNMKLVLQLKEKDIADIKDDGNSLYDDSRYKIGYLKFASYPHIIETELIYESTALLNLPAFFPVAGDEYLTYGRLTVSYDSLNPIRYKTYNLEQEPVKINLGNQREELLWEFHIQTPFEYKSHYLPIERQIPIVRLAPTYFTVQGYKGNMKTWNDFGKWFATLSKDKDVLPDELKPMINEAIEGKLTIAEKTKAIYQLMQTQTRYISVQLGIGGWQPFDAKYVYRNKYGDCKALSNYTHAMLKYAGIKNYLALATRGDYKAGVDPSFPSNDFNHMIVMVPDENNEPIWLECTDQNIPFAHIGFDNQGRYTLVINENGGELMKTHEYESVENISKTQTNFEIDELGNANIVHEESQFGNNQDYYRYRLYKQSNDNLEKFIINGYNFSKATIKKMDFNQIGDRSDSTYFSFNVDVRSYANKSGKRLFIPLNTLSKWKRSLPDLKDRKVEIMFWQKSKDYAVTTYQIPKNTTAEILPKDVLIESDFGMYHLSIDKKEDNQIQITRVVDFTKTVIMPDKFDDLQAFIKKIDQLESQKMIFVQK